MKTNTKTQATHTPGEWMRGSPREQVITDCNGKEIASVYCSNKDWRANARLIAAAPDLLTALEWAETLLRHRLESDNLIAKAIAKAKGE